MPANVCNNFEDRLQLGNNRCRSRPSLVAILSLTMRLCFTVTFLVLELLDALHQSSEFRLLECRHERAEGCTTTAIQQAVQMIQMMFFTHGE